LRFDDTNPAKEDAHFEEVSFAIIYEFLDFLNLNIMDYYILYKFFY